jgi:hypothetical protein
MRHLANDRFYTREKWSHPSLPTLLLTPRVKKIGRYSSPVAPMICYNLSVWLDKGKVVSLNYINASESHQAKLPSRQNGAVTPAARARVLF